MSAQITSVSTQITGAPSGTKRLIDFVAGEYNLFCFVISSKKEQNIIWMFTEWFMRV